MDSEPLKIGFIGGAINSAVGQTHKIAISMDRRWDLVSGCFSRDENTNRETAKAWGVKDSRVYNDWHTMLDAEKESLDAIAVLTPTPAHKDIVLTAIKQGYPVICEKALATASTEANEIRNCVEKHDGFLAVTYNYTGYPMLRELKQLIQRGQIGQVNQIHIEMPQEGFSRLGKQDSKPSPQDWRLKDSSVPTLSLDLGVHIHHIIRFLTNQTPLEVVAISNNYGLIDDIVDNTMCIARYTGNIDCQIWYGKTALGHRNGLRVRVYGSIGSAEWYQMSPEELLVNDNKGRQSILDRASVDIQVADLERYNRFKAGHPAGFIEAFANHYYDIADDILAYKNNSKTSSPWVFRTDEALEGLLMLEAIEASAKQHTWQDITHL